MLLFIVSLVTALTATLAGSVVIEHRIVLETRYQPLQKRLATGYSFSSRSNLLHPNCVSCCPDANLLTSQQTCCAGQCYPIEATCCPGGWWCPSGYLCTSPVIVYAGGVTTCITPYTYGLASATTLAATHEQSATPSMPTPTSE